MIEARYYLLLSINSRVSSSELNSKVNNTWNIFLIFDLEIKFLVYLHALPFIDYRLLEKTKKVV